MAKLIKFAIGFIGSYILSFMLNFMIAEIPEPAFQSHNVGRRMQKVNKNAILNIIY